MFVGEDVTRVILAHEPSASALNHRTSKVERGTATQAAAGNGAPELILLKRFLPWPGLREHLEETRRRQRFEPVVSSFGGMTRLCDFASQPLPGTDRANLDDLYTWDYPL